MSYLLSGIQRLARDRSLWAYVWKPLLHAAWIYLALGVLLWVLVVGAVLRMLPESGLLALVLGLLGGLAAVALWLFLAGMLFVAIAGFVSSLMWEPLAAAILRQSGVQTDGLDPSLPARMGDTIARLALLVFVLLVSAAGVFIAGPVAGWAGAGLLGLLDYTAPACMLRGHLLPAQAVRVLTIRSVPFAASVGLIAFVPLLNLLLLPACVIGGTLLVQDLSPDLNSPGPCAANARLGTR